MKMSTTRVISGLMLVALTFSVFASEGDRNGELFGHTEDKHTVSFEKSEPKQLNFLSETERPSPPNTKS